MGSSPAERKRLKRLVDGFAGRRLLVLGDYMLDHYIRGGASRLSPEAPVPVVRVGDESFVPGGAGNVAANLTALGAKVAAMGVIGEDEAGRQLVAELAGRGIGVEGLLHDAGRLTSQKCRVLAERHQVVRFDRETEGALSAACEKRLLKALGEALKEADAVVLSDYGKGVVCPAVIRAAIAGARRRRIPVAVDPKIEHFQLYRGVTSVTPNAAEAWAGMRRTPKAGQDEIERLGRDILKTLKSESVLITRGADGMSLFKKGGKVLHIPTRAREVFDVTGAGDTVIAAFTLALAAGASLEDAASLSNHAAGLVVAKLGTAVTTPQELSKDLS